MQRPAVAELTDRHPKPLHRTLPMWARQADGSGKVEWRIYAPHRFGGALYMTIYGGPGKTRAEIAAEIREARRIIWGRTKIDAFEDAAQAKTKRPRGKSEAVPAVVPGAAAQEPPSVPTSELELGDVDVVAVESADDDMPPWRDEDSIPATGAATPETGGASDAQGDTTPKPGQYGQEQGSLF